jgi:DNA polymerase theta
VAFDYKTLEVFVAAIISGDEIMQEACRSADFHLETAKKMAPYAWNCTPEEVEHEVLVKKDKTKRTAAKGITFSVLYGAGPHSLADTLNCSLEQAMMLMKSYEKAYPRFATWVRYIHAFAQENGFVHIPWNGQPARMRPLVGAGFQRFGGDGARFSQALRQAQNSPPQGMAAQYAIAASMDLEEQFRSERMEAMVVGNVHDSILVETRLSMVDEIIPRMYYAMTSLPTGCDLRLQVDAEVGETWGTLEHVDLKPYVGAES